MKIADLVAAIIRHNSTRSSQALNLLYDFSYHRDRYMIDFAEDYQGSGWEQFDTDQDAWYYGVWVNPKTYQTLSYTEGDIHLVVCNGPVDYSREIRSMIEYYGEGFIAKTFDAEGETIYRQDRSKFLVSEQGS